MSRWDSAAIVPNTSELLPDPETPVNTVSRRFGSSTLTSLRLLTRAPVTRIRSWLSAAYGVGVLVRAPFGAFFGGLIGSPGVGGRRGHATGGSVGRASRILLDRAT